MSAQRDWRVKAGELANLAGIAAEEARRGGVIWTLEASDDLNANLVPFPAGEGVGEHVNDEVDVIFVGISGSGFISVDGGTRLLSCGTLVFVPKGARRSTRSATEDFAYLTVHRKRGPVRLGSKKGSNKAAESRGKA